jgi:serine/threonine protein kinase
VSTPPAPRWPVGLPTRLRPIGLLGRGSSAAVWQALDSDSGVEVAVKVLDGPALRHEQEARALGRLRGVPGVCAVHELGRTPDGVAWMIIDLAPGGTLADRPPLTPGDAVRVWRITAATLAAVHELELCHGDVTPSNVLLDELDRPLLADFGLAELGPSGTTQLPAGLTPAFAAPERLRGATPTPASDVYALAATLRACLADEASGRLGELLDRCRDARPSARPTAAELCRELDGRGRR